MLHALSGKYKTRKLHVDAPAVRTPERRWGRVWKGYTSLTLKSKTVGMSFTLLWRMSSRQALWGWTLRPRSAVVLTEGLAYRTKTNPIRMKYNQTPLISNLIPEMSKSPGHNSKVGHKSWAESCNRHPDNRITFRAGTRMKRRTMKVKRKKNESGGKKTHTKSKKIQKRKAWRWKRLRVKRSAITQVLFMSTWPCLNITEGHQTL